MHDGFACFEGCSFFPWRADLRGPSIDECGDSPTSYLAMDTLSILHRSLPAAVKLMLLNGVSDTIPKKLL